VAKNPLIFVYKNAVGAKSGEGRAGATRYHIPAMTWRGGEDEGSIREGKIFLTAPLLVKRRKETPTNLDWSALSSSYRRPFASLAGSLFLAEEDSACFFSARVDRSQNSLEHSAVVIAPLLLLSRLLCGAAPNVLPSFLLLAEAESSSLRLAAAAASTVCKVCRPPPPLP